MKVVIVVDMQNDFINGALGSSEAAAIVSAVEARIKNSQNELILFTKDTHDSNYLSTPEGKKLPVVHCVKDTHGWQIEKTILDAWKSNKNTIIVKELTENTFNKPVFGSVELVKFLKERQNEITEIEILGVCTDICVISNAIMIKNTLPNIKICVNQALCAGVTPKSHQEAINTMAMCQIDII
jgi:nicotinamidase-related amidase